MALFLFGRSHSLDDEDDPALRCDGYDTHRVFEEETRGAMVEDDGNAIRGVLTGDKRIRNNSKKTRVVDQSIRRENHQGIVKLT